MSQLLGLIGIGLTMWYVFTQPASNFSGFWDLPSAVLLGGGPPCIMLLSHTLGDLFTGFRLLGSSIFSSHARNQAEIMEYLTRASQVVRSDGLGALVALRDRTRYDLLRDGFSLIVNDFKPDEIRNNLMARVNAKQTKFALAASLFENMAKLCPGVGMIGTLIGLITMLKVMSDPSKIGGGLALALITTLYGLMLGTIIYGPWGEKIHIEAEKMLEIDLMVVEGVINIKSKKSSAHMKDIMKAYGSKPGAAPVKGAS